MGGITQISTITSIRMWSLWVGCSHAPSHYSQMLYCAKQWPQSGRAIVVPGRNRSLLRRKLHIVPLSTVPTSAKLCRYVSATNCHQGANFHFVQKPSNEQHLKNSKHKQNEIAHEHFLWGRAIVLVTHNRFATGRDLMWIEAIQLSVQGSKRKHCSFTLPPHIPDHQYVGGCYDSLVTLPVECTENCLHLSALKGWRS